MRERRPKTCQTRDPKADEALIALARLLARQAARDAATVEEPKGKQPRASPPRIRK
jgi:hypothetical protein